MRCWSPASGLVWPRLCSDSQSSSPECSSSSSPPLGLGGRDGRGGRESYKHCMTFEPALHAEGTSKAQYAHPTCMSCSSLLAQQHVLTCNTTCVYTCTLCMCTVHDHTSQVCPVLCVQQSTEEKCSACLVRTERTADSSAESLVVQWLVHEIISSATTN